jgi:hypothetical protein
MHRFITFVLCFVYLGTASAEFSLRGASNQLREIATRKKRSAICYTISTGVYETRFVSRWTSSMAATSSKGSCASVCKNLCAGYTSFEVPDNKCICSSATASPSSAPSASPMAAPLQETVAPQQEAVDPCDTRPCASNQLCMNTGTSFTCEPLKCANPFGNPCGPASACKDTATGFTCASTLGSDICPAGCGPNSQCVSGQCRCDTGFSRPKPYLGCIPSP